MNQIIMYMMAAGALLGGLDCIFGNRLGLGKRFEEGFNLLGPVALGQAGIICLAPVLSNALGPIVSQAYHALRQDPGMFGSIFAIDMGGFQMSALLADDPLIGSFAGIVVASMLGCTITFTLPVGMGLLPVEKQDAFARGLMYGLITLPITMVLGALICGISLGAALWCCLPVIVLAVILSVGILRFPKGTLRCFRVFSKLISILITLGLTVGAVQYMTGWELLPGLTPLTEAMGVVSSIGIVLLGALPVAELLQRLLKRPMMKLAPRLHLSESGTVNMLICAVSVAPALASLREMDDTDITVNGAFAVCAASCLAAHLGFAVAVAPAMTTAMIVAKLVGGVIGAALALFMVKRKA